MQPGSCPKEKMQGQIQMMDFDSQKVRMIAPGQDQELRTLGFMNEDLIYRLLQSGDILTDENGHSTEGADLFPDRGL